MKERRPSSFVWFGVLASCLLSGCLAYRDNVVTVRDAVGSSDHRIFRIGSATKLMMEPVLWKLEDTGKVNFDRPVTDYFRDPLPPEFGRITLRQLHDNKTGFPREFLSPWSLGDLDDALSCGLMGTHLYRKFDARKDFVRCLWTEDVRAAVRKGGSEYSNMGYALMMMAILDVTGQSLEELCQEHLVKPYGLKDTTFAPGPGMLNRLTPACAGHLPWLYPAGMEVPDHRGGDVLMCAGGMLSSASDMLRVAYVILPHLDRSKGILCKHRLDCGRTVYYRSGMVYGGHSFVGFDPQAKRAVVVLKNVTCWDNDEGFDLMESLIAPRRRL